MATTDSDRVHRSTTFPRRSGDHAPNLATLDQLRSRGRNGLLLPGARRARATARGCASS